MSPLQHKRRAVRLVPVLTLCFTCACAAQKPADPADQFLSRLNDLAESGQAGQVKAVLGRMNTTFATSRVSSPEDIDGECRQGKRLARYTDVFETNRHRSPSATLLGVTSFRGDTSVYADEMHEYECIDGRPIPRPVSTHVSLRNVEDTLCISLPQVEARFGDTRFFQSTDGAQGAWSVTREQFGPHRFRIGFTVKGDPFSRGCLSTITISTSE